MTSINRILMRNGTQYTGDIIRYKRQWKMITLIDSRKIYHRNKALLGYYRTQYTRKFFHRSCDRIQIKCSNNDTISSVLLLCSFHLKEDHICASHICASWKWQLNWKKRTVVSAHWGCSQPESLSLCMTSNRLPVHMLFNKYIFFSFFPF